MDDMCLNCEYCEEVSADNGIYMCCNMKSDDYHEDIFLGNCCSQYERNKEWKPYDVVKETE